MAHHPAVERVIGRIHADVIGGAADTAKEVIQAVREVIDDSPAATGDALAGEVEVAVLALFAALPSFAPPLNALHRVMRQVERDRANGEDLDTLRAHLLETIAGFLTFVEDALQRVARCGAELLKDGDTLFMYSMSSTVWRVIKAAHDQGKALRVIVTESRPANEGLWTVERMIEYGIPVEVSIDAAIGVLVPQSDVVMVGADSVAATGETLCKLGTYPTALVAKAHGVPFYIAADTLKFDTATLLGLPFRVDPIPRADVLDEDEYPEAPVVGPLFDVTPPELVRGIITERGVLNPAAAYTVLQEMPISQTLLDLLPDWAHGKL
jgi:ribose 1,5-bisphosphate isomerase